MWTWCPRPHSKIRQILLTDYGTHSANWIEKRFTVILKVIKSELLTRHRKISQSKNNLCIKSNCHKYNKRHFEDWNVERDVDQYLRQIANTRL